MKFKLTKLSKTNDIPIRSFGVNVNNSYLEEFGKMPVPEIEQPFFFGGMRTSYVEEILEQKENYCKFRTMNSVYELKEDG